MVLNAHVEQRLEQRVLPATAERAFEVLRYPKRLAALVAGRSELSGAPRVAIPLTPEPHGPRLVVDRSGKGVTCLAAGMACSAPELPWPVVESYLAVQAQRIRLAIARSRLVRAAADGRNPLLRALEHGYRMTRAEFDQLRTFSPLLVDFVADEVRFLAQELSFWQRRPCPLTGPLLETAWRKYSSACHLLMAAGHEDLAAGACVAGMGAPDVLLGARATWWSVNLPERTMEVIERWRGIANQPHGRSKRRTLTPLMVCGLAFAPLLAISQRYPYLHDKALDLLAACYREAGRIDDLHRVRGKDALAAVPHRVGVAAVRLAPMMMRSLTSPEGAPGLLGKADQIVARMRAAPTRGTPDLVRCAAEISPWHAEILRRWDPLRDLAVPRPTHPVPLESLSAAERDRVNLWRLALRDNLVPPVNDQQGVPILLSLAPMEALLPVEQPDPWWRLGEGVRYLQETLSIVASIAKQPPPRPEKRAPAPSPNAPCPCGSGKKSKKCCAVVA